MFKLFRTLYHILYHFRSLPKTIYFNFRYFPFSIALKLPVIVSHRVYLKRTKGSVTIEGPIKRGMITIGFGEVGIFDKKSRSVWEVSGEVIFKGVAEFTFGSKISIDGKMIFGKDFAVSSRTQFICKKLVTIGDDVIISWDTLIMDTDLHNIRKDGEVINPPMPVVIGNHVWVGCRCTILKGTIIPDNTIISANSFLAKEYRVGNCILGGIPARLWLAGTEWDRSPQ